MRATWVTIHHEGAGRPTDRVSRFLDTDRYSAGIGVTLYELRRAPEDSFITTGQKGHCLQICLSGNRMTHAVTDTDVTMIRWCCDDARARGWLVDNPEVKHHGDNHKSDCPGTKTNERRADIHAACQKTHSSTASPPPPQGRKNMVGIARTPTGKGYWQCGPDGGVFCFGDADMYGSMGGEKLNAPIVDMAAAPNGEGYALAASDGGVFTFGNVGFEGSMGGQALNAPVCGIEIDADGTGYWLVAEDGGIFAFKAEFYGSAAGKITPWRSP